VDDSPNGSRPTHHGTRRRDSIGYGVWRLGARASREPGTRRTGGDVIDILEARRILINERPATATRRTLRDLPPAARKRLAVVSGGVAVFGLGLMLWRGSAQQAGYFAAILVVSAACSWVGWVRS
jgi:hypothetical protein